MASDYVVETTTKPTSELFFLNEVLVHVTLRQLECLTTKATMTMQKCQSGPHPTIGPIPPSSRTNRSFVKRHDKLADTKICRKIQCAHHGFFKCPTERHIPGITESSSCRKTVRSARQCAPFAACANLLPGTSIGPSRAMRLPVRGTGCQPGAGALSRSTLACGASICLCDLLPSTSRQLVQRGPRRS